eukprot:g35262.t1
MVIMNSRRPKIVMGPQATATSVILGLRRVLYRLSLIGRQLTEIRISANLDLNLGSDRNGTMDLNPKVPLHINARNNVSYSPALWDLSSEDTKIFVKAPAISSFASHDNL